MGNVFAIHKRQQPINNTNPELNRRTTSSQISSRGKSEIISTNRSMSRQPSTSVTVSGTGPKMKRSNNIKNKYSFIPDNFTTLEEVTIALRDAGLESSNLILGIDFTKSNEWTGKISFNNRSLHAIGDTPNPYETAISIIGKTIAPFDEDNLIPCFGFGDATTHDQEVFSFHSDHTPCHGFEEVLSCYRKIVPSLRLSGPTSYAPVIEAAIDIVEKSGGQYHVLVIVADGQVTRSVDTHPRELSPQEKQTIQSIVDASSYPLSIILVGVGDGPWEDMRKFDDKIPAREFDNFQFVNFTAIMSKQSSPSEKETAFALAALMEIPLQYRAAMEFGLLKRRTGRAPKIVPRPPPVLYSRRAPLEHEVSTTASSPAIDDRTQACPICLTSPKDLAFGCGHMTCRDCGSRVTNCPICRQRITNRLRLYS
ncbi:E3 ubiquitin-protein ligase RGLG4-like isoform X1 [Mangifera indica]|uniref:E3 ubiquitin-protein ligase RGLG4-like isoform X1 n=1 Tax=Mangifera indica TaxID=29780 RepID=UPI001CF9FD4D|nr:E3 ubiquitin-protein ligase RGLG4-like isoform X1 [Mangifera indica]XP_044480597.1 E3 ubiquitin-protein ligase RGLG4-like isoform X1 [Mangifera indica]